MTEQERSELEQAIQPLLERAISPLREDLKRIEKEIQDSNYKFDTYQKASDQVVRLATTIVIAAASVVVLSPVLQAVASAVAAFTVTAR